jgi:hypothetical protein
MPPPLPDIVAAIATDPSLMSENTEPTTVSMDRVKRYRKFRNVAHEHVQ